MPEKPDDSIISVSYFSQPRFARLQNGELNGEISWVPCSTVSGNLGECVVTTPTNSATGYSFRDPEAAQKLIILCLGMKKGLSCFVFKSECTQALFSSLRPGAHRVIL